MRFTRRQALSVATSALGLWLVSSSSHAAGQDLAVIVNPENSIHSLDAADLEAIFTASRRYWSGSRAIVAFNLPAKSDPRVKFDRVVLHMDPDDAANYWIDRKVRGGTPPPRQVPDPMILVRLVEKLSASIGYVPSTHVSDKVKVVARIVGNDVKGP
jgi:ABC-type phosphate transport system substrate-binding protein